MGNSSRVVPVKLSGGDERSAESSPPWPEFEFFGPIAAAFSHKSSYRQASKSISDQGASKMRRDSLRDGGVEASTFTGTSAAQRQRGATRKQQIGRGHASGQSARLTRAAAAAMTAAVAVAGFSVGKTASGAQVTSSWVGPASGNWNAGGNWSAAMPSNGSPA